MDRQRANGGLAEHYSESDTRAPTWLIAGDAVRTADLVGLDGRAADGGSADPEVVQRWLDDGTAPNGESGRAFTKTSVHGFDLTFAAPKSGSLLRALTDDVGEKVMQAAHLRAIDAAITYLHEHAGYTRVHNPLTGTKDLEPLPGLAAIAYQHETSRCGDPHLHTHVIVPNRQAREDGNLVSLDSKSLYHEAKAAGIIYQAILRHVLHTELGVEWTSVDAFTGMAEIAGVDPNCLKAWSQRSTRLREWAQSNLVVVDGKLSAAQTAAAQKATRPAKPESLAWDALKQQWRADARGLVLDRAAHYGARAERQRAARRALDRARLVEMAARIDKAAFTRADMVELIGAQLPVDVLGDPRELIEQIVDTVGVRISATRRAHEREGHEKYTLDVIMAEEIRIFTMADEADTRSRDVRSSDLNELSADQARAAQYRGLPVSGPANVRARGRRQNPLAARPARGRRPRVQTGAGAGANRQGGRRGDTGRRRRSRAHRRQIAALARHGRAPAECPHGNRRR